jgi:hypothetical protein
MLGRKTKGQKELTALEKRISKLATGDLLKWADQALFGIGRSIADYERYKSIESLKEAEMGAEALHKVLETVITRISDDS